MPTLSRELWMYRVHGYALFNYVERFAFYERAIQAYAIVSTSETALYANVILKKGVVV